MKNMLKNLEIRNYFPYVAEVLDFLYNIIYVNILYYIIYIYNIIIKYNIISYNSYKSFKVFKDSKSILTKVNILFSSIRPLKWSYELIQPLYFIFKNKTIKHQYLLAAAPLKVSSNTTAATGVLGLKSLFDTLCGRNLVSPRYVCDHGYVRGEIVDS